TRFSRDWSSDVCSSDLHGGRGGSANPDFVGGPKPAGINFLLILNKIAARIFFLTHAIKCFAVGAFLTRNKNNHIIFGGKTLQLWLAIRDLATNRIIGIKLDRKSVV